MNEEITQAVGAPFERHVRPRLWMTSESALRMKSGGNAKGAVPVHGKRSSVAVIPLYDQAALDAALALWPRDCRLCVNFTTRSGGCTSTVQCVDSLQYKATTPRQYWIAGPNVGIEPPKVGSNDGLGVCPIDATDKGV